MQQLKSLPGIENYENNEQLIEEILKELDAEGMMPLIAYSAAWSTKETQDFFSHPDRQPFKSKIEFSNDLCEKTRQYLTIGNWLRHRYEFAPADQKQQFGEDYRNFHEFSLYQLFLPLEQEYKDWAAGINSIDRQNGTIHPSEKTLTLIQYAAETVASQYGQDAINVLEQTLMALEGGNLDLISSYLFNNRGEPILRETLQQIAIIRSRDREIPFKKLPLIWLVERYSLAMGLNMDKVYKLYGLPNGKTIESKLDSFLNQPGLIEEFMHHLRAEAETALINVSQNGGQLEIYSILEARANHLRLPDRVASWKELQDKTKLVMDFVGEIFPLAIVESPKSVLDAPARMGAVTRPSNTTYWNSNRELVNVVSLDPRRKIDIFAEIAGHEAAHKVHAVMLALAENAGFVPKGSNERVDSSVKEELSQLAEHVAGVIWRQRHPEQSETNIVFCQQASSNGEWTNLVTALGKRFQAPYAVIQRRVRLQMERLISDGQTKLSETDLFAIVDENTPVLHDWLNRGVSIAFPAAGVAGNTNILDRTDGVVYLTKYLADGKPGQTTAVTTTQSEAIEKKLNMKNAFEMRYGESWILNRQARIILLSLMAEAGRNLDITSYGNYVIDADPDALRQRLISWGLREEDL